MKGVLVNEACIGHNQDFEQLVNNQNAQGNCYKKSNGECEIGKILMSVKAREKNLKLKIQKLEISDCKLGA